jgi:hypothetical protein
MLTSPDVACGAAAKTVIPLATFGIGIGTLAVVLIVVEIAHRVHAPRGARPTRRSW